MFCKLQYKVTSTLNTQIGIRKIYKINYMSIINISETFESYNKYCGDIFLNKNIFNFISNLSNKIYFSWSR